MMRKTRMTALAIATATLWITATTAYSMDEIKCWFPPSWKVQRERALTIARVLTEKAGVSVRPRIARYYPEILAAFSAGEPALVYAGSFVQAIIHSRDFGTPLVQNMDEKALYSGIMIYPGDADPVAILRHYPEAVAFAKGASSGESSAKAATGGKAALPVGSHASAAEAVMSGKARAAFVKNWWWEANRSQYPALSVYRAPGISVEKNPDNILTASKAVPVDLARRTAEAAVAGKAAFGAPAMVPFDAQHLKFSLDLMEKGGIDPLSYQW
jgi:ABC-type phosphate/phosphonate transport system substrate-binding protein